MLSRTADHLYWMSRYIERAESLARLVDAHYRMSLLPHSGETLAESLSATMTAMHMEEAYKERHKAVEPRAVFEFVSLDQFAMVVTVGGHMVRIVKMPFTPSQATILGWEVTGIETVVAGLTGKGAVFERFSFFEQDELGIWTAPSGDKVAWFKDPDGNTLSVSEHTATT